jgi:superfamily I DNA/RNA helicase
LLLISVQATFNGIGDVNSSIMGPTRGSHFNIAKWVELGYNYDSTSEFLDVSQKSFSHPNLTPPSVFPNTTSF